MHLEKGSQLLNLKLINLTEKNIEKAKDKVEKSLVEKVNQLNEKRKEKDKVVSQNQIKLQYEAEGKRLENLRAIRDKDKKVENILELSNISHTLQVDNILDLRQQMMKTRKCLAQTTSNLRRDIQNSFHVTK